MKKQARAALFSTNDRQSTATGKPLFSSGSSSSFFKPMNIPTYKVPSAAKMSDNDYESITLMKMRQAERDRVILLQQRQQSTN